MREGSICRCIADFQSIMPGELSVFKGDLFQVHSVEDRLWVHGEAAGGFGKVPSSCLAEVDNSSLIPATDEHEDLFVVFAEFNPQEPEDLPLTKGTVIVGEKPIDAAWWRGRAYGKSGVFPVNFVWRINKKLLESSRGEEERAVSKLGRVLNTFMPQLDEELPLIPGDTVHITTIYHDDWCRGTCCGREGKFPMNFVEIIDEEYLPDSIVANDFNSTNNNNNNEIVKNTWTTVVYRSRSSSSNVNSNDYSQNILLNLSEENNENDDQFIASGHEISSAQLPLSELPQQSGNTVGAQISSSSATWKDVVDDEDIFNDDYFKQNMPGLFSGSAEQVFPAVSLPKVSGAKSLPAGDSITEEVENYFDNRAPLRPSLSTNTRRGVVNSSRFDEQVDQMIHTGYNQDNTGINPYAKALYDFKSQYPNELSFLKDEIIHLIKHVDSHWTLGQVGELRGIFPTSYVEIIVDCVDGAVENFLMRPLLSSEIPKLEGRAVAEYNYVAVEPSDITVVQGERLDIIEFIDDNWAIVENADGLRGMCPRNHFKLLLDDEVVKENIFPENKESEKASLLPEASIASPANDDKRLFSKTDFPITSKNIDEELNKNVTFLKSMHLSDLKLPAASQTEKVSGKPTNIDLLSEVDLDFLEQLGANAHKSSEESVIMKESSENKIPPSRPPLPERANLVTKHNWPSLSDSTATSNASSTQKPSKPKVPPLPVRITNRKPNVLCRQAALHIPVTSENFDLPTSYSVNASVDLLGSICSGSEEENAQRQNDMEIASSKADSNEIGLVKPEETFCESGKEGPAHFPQDIRHNAVSIHSQYLRSNSGHAPLRPAPPPPSARREWKSKTIAVASCFAPSSSSVTTKKEEEITSIKKSVPLCALPEDSDCSDDVSASSFKRGTTDRHTIALTSVEGVSSAGDSKKDDASDGKSNLEHSHSVRFRHSTGAISRTKSHSISVSNDNSKQDRNKVLRQEAIQELLITEIEYIHDLEAMKQVTASCSKQAKEAGVDIKALIGNLVEVIDCAKSLERGLQEAVCKPPETECIGEVFVRKADQLCLVYKAYCAHHTTSVEPLLKQYSELSAPNQFLELIMQELRQHKIQLLDARSVLIKPVQRILKYPLFLDRLLDYTPSEHVDYKPLQEAQFRISSVTAEVNMYSKRMDMVRKYGATPSNDATLLKVSKLNLHSVAKKTARVTTKLTASLGLTTLTEDAKMSKLEIEYRHTMTAVTFLLEVTQSLLQLISDRQKAEISIIQGIADAVLAGRPSGSAILDAAVKTAQQSYTSAVSVFQSVVHQSVLQPLRAVCAMTQITDRLIDKRMDKLLDFDRAQHKMDRNRDPSRTRALEEDLSQCRSNYQALNSQLLEELPVFCRVSSAILGNAFTAYLSARTVLQGRLAKRYFNLKHTLSETVGAQFSVKYEDALKKLSKLTFGPDKRFVDIHKSFSEKLQKSLENSTAETAQTISHQSDSARLHLLNKYSCRPSTLYVLSRDHSSADPHELNLARGSVVAVLKEKDPMGSSQRWFVDNGVDTGFVSSAVLKPFQMHSLSGSDHNVIPSSMMRDSCNSHQSATVSLARVDQITDCPPRYEDIFPSSGDVASALPCANTGLQSVVIVNQQDVTVENFAHPTGARPRTSVPNLSTVSSAMDTVRPRSSSMPLEEHYSEVDSSIVPHGNIYDTPTEDVPDHSDIMDRTGALEEDEEDKKSSSHIYEELDNSDEDEKEAALEFYYALYKFGGDKNSNQLSLYEGQVVLLLHGDVASGDGRKLPMSSRQWWFVENRDGERGYVPASYLSVYTFTP